MQNLGEEVDLDLEGEENGMSRSRKATLRRLVSLSSLGAAALAAGAGDARATVFWSGPINTGNTVGFGPGAVGSATVLPAGLGPVNLRFFLSRTSTSGSSTSHRVNIAARYLGSHTFNFAGTGGQFLKGFGAGAVLQAGPRIAFGRVASRSGHNTRTTHSTGTGTTQHSTTGTGRTGRFVNNFLNGNSYALFSFKTNNTFDKGWARLAVSGSSSRGPVVVLKSYAYDDSGNALRAGQTTDIPEPSGAAVELTALAALVMGGSATRRWRASRRAITA